MIDGPSHKEIQILAKTTKTYHHGDLKAAMVQAVLALVREKGPRGFTLNEASRRAGVSKSAPYKHFRDKDALLIEVAIQGTRLMEAELREAAEHGKTAREKLLSVLLSYVRFSGSHPDYFAVMSQSGIDKIPYPEINDPAAAAFGVAFELAHQIESTAQAARELCIAVWAMAHGFAILRSEGAFDSAAQTIVTDDTIRLIANRFLFREK
jgi:AcrR family transcriptional regulator